MRNITLVSSTVLVIVKSSVTEMWVLLTNFFQRTFLNEIVFGHVHIFGISILSKIGSSNVHSVIVTKLLYFYVIFLYNDL